MKKETITYVDYNGVERTEDFYFNLNESELRDMEFETPGGMKGLITGIIQSKDVAGMMRLYKKIILWSYGEKSPDGKRFIKGKNHSLAEEFAETEAYNVLFTKFIEDPDAFSDFVNKIIAPGLMDKAKASEEYRTAKARIDAGEDIVKVLSE